jgi:hypothetical protein
MTMLSPNSGLTNGNFAGVDAAAEGAIDGVGCACTAPDEARSSMDVANEAKAILEIIPVSYSSEDAAEN